MSQHRRSSRSSEQVKEAFLPSSRRMEPKEIETSKINLGKLAGYGELRDKTAEFDERVTLFTFRLDGGKERILERFFNVNSDGSRTAGGLVEFTAVVSEDTHLDMGVIILSEEQGDTVISGKCGLYGHALAVNSKISDGCVLHHYVDLYDSDISDGVKLFNRVQVRESVLTGHIDVSDEVQISNSKLVCEKPYSLVLAEEASVLCRSTLISTGSSEIRGMGRVCNSTLIGSFEVCKRGDPDREKVMISDSILTGDFHLTGRSWVENCTFIGRGNFSDRAHAQYTNDTSSDVNLSDHQTLIKGIFASPKTLTFNGAMPKLLLRDNE